MPALGTRKDILIELFTLEVIEGSDLMKVLRAFFLALRQY
jgi:hypothetical protein